MQYSAAFFDELLKLGWKPTGSAYLNQRRWICPCGRPFAAPRLAIKITDHLPKCPNRKEKTN